MCVQYRAGPLGEKKGKGLSLPPYHGSVAVSLVSPHVHSLGPGEDTLCRGDPVMSVWKGPGAVWVTLGMAVGHVVTEVSVLLGGTVLCVWLYVIVACGYTWFQNSSLAQRPFPGNMGCQSSLPESGSEHL